MRHIAIATLAIFLMSALCVPASAYNVTVSIQGQQVHSSISLSLVQNITALPILTATQDSSSQPNLSAAFDQGLSRADPNAASSGVSVGVSSTRAALNLTCAIDVSGISKRNGSIVSVNMTWLAFNVTSDLRSGNLSYNTIGNRYFTPIMAYYANASRLVGRPNATINGVTFFANGTSLNPTQAQNYVDNFTMLGFGQLRPSLDQWNRTYTLTNNTTTWRYSPPQLLNFSMRIQRSNVTTMYVANYAYNAIISVSGLSRAQGHVILVDVGTGEMEWGMAVIVILAVVSAVSVQVLYGRRKKRLGKFQRR